jgi:hypothetical protein
VPWPTLTVAFSPGTSTSAREPTGTVTLNRTWPSARLHETAASPYGVRCFAAALVSWAVSKGFTTIVR